MIRTFQAVGPVLGIALKSGQLFNFQCELTEPDPDILCKYDVKIPMSEGFPHHIYRSKTAAEKGKKVSLVMFAHPYDNNLSPRSC
jgi:hypothetical protein